MEDNLSIELSLKNFVENINRFLIVYHNLKFVDFISIKNQQDSASILNEFLTIVFDLYGFLYLCQLLSKNQNKCSTYFFYYCSSSSLLFRHFAVFSEEILNELTLDNLLWKNELFIILLANFFIRENNLPKPIQDLEAADINFFEKIMLYGKAIESTEEKLIATPLKDLLVECSLICFVWGAQYLSALKVYDSNIAPNDFKGKKITKKILMLQKLMKNHSVFIFLFNCLLTYKIVPISTVKDRAKMIISFLKSLEPHWNQMILVKKLSSEHGMSDVFKQSSRAVVDKVLFDLDNVIRKIDASANIPKKIKKPKKPNPMQSTQPPIETKQLPIPIPAPVYYQAPAMGLIPPPSMTSSTGKPKSEITFQKTIKIQDEKLESKPKKQKPSAKIYELSSDFKHTFKAMITKHLQETLPHSFVLFVITTLKKGFIGIKPDEVQLIDQTDRAKYKLPTNYTHKVSHLVKEKKYTGLIFSVFAHSGTQQKQACLIFDKSFPSL